MATNTLFRVGSLAQDAVSGIKCCNTYATTGKYDVFKQSGVDYQVGAGTFYVTSMIVTGVGTANIEIGYGNNAKTNDTAPTSYVAVAGLFINADTEPYSVFIPIPTGKYPHIRNAGTDATYVTLFGIEI